MPDHTFPDNPAESGTASSRSTALENVADTGPSGNGKPSAWLNRLSVSAASSNLADGFILGAAPLLAATITRNPVAIAAVLVAQRLPWFLLVLPGGVVVDSFDRRTLIIGGNIIRGLLFACLAIGFAVGGDRLWLLYVVLFLSGTIEVVVDNAVLAVVPAIVDRDDLERANGRLAAIQSACNDLAGKAIGSWLFVVGSAVPFGATGVGFAAAAVGLRGVPSVPIHRIEPAETTSVWGRVAEGWRWFRDNRIVKLYAYRSAVINLFSAATNAILVLVALERLGLSSVGFGLLLGAASIGGISGGVVAHTVVDRLGRGGATIASSLLPAAGFIVLATTNNAAVAAIGIALANAGAAIGNVVGITLRQAAIPDELLGRVTSVYRLFVIGAVPIGGILGGVAAARFGITSPFWIGAMALILVTIATARPLSNRNLDGIR